MDLIEEFARQANRLIQKGYPDAAGVSIEEFDELIHPLAQRIAGLSAPVIDLENGRLPFVLVIKSNFVSAEKAFSLVEKDGKSGITKLFPREPADFQTIEDVVIPDRLAYLLVDIDRGRETINVAPVDAMKMIAQENRSPLTIDEGIAVITHFPGYLIKNNCFSLLASRCPADRRVPAIWINANKNPHLGWCWDGNPHTWLGSASCLYRI